MRIDNALTWAAEQLEGGESPSVDAKVMLANILGKSQTYLFTWPDKTLDAAQKAQFEADVAKRKRVSPWRILSASVISGPCHCLPRQIH